MLKSDHGIYIELDHTKWRMMMKMDTPIQLWIVVHAIDIVKIKILGKLNKSDH